MDFIKLHRRSLKLRRFFSVSCFPKLLQNQKIFTSCLVIFFLLNNNLASLMFSRNICNFESKIIKETILIFLIGHHDLKSTDREKSTRPYLHALRQGLMKFTVPAALFEIQLLHSVLLRSREGREHQNSALSTGYFRKVYRSL